MKGFQLRYLKDDVVEFVLERKGEIDEVNQRMLLLDFHVVFL